MPKTIRCNPTWEWAVSVLLEVVEHGTDEAKAEAKAEIKKAARGYDHLLRKHTDYFEPKEAG
jgi:hypothetical protein